MSCSVCRLRHTACDRAIPTCGRCAARGMHKSCSYTPEDFSLLRHTKRALPSRASPMGSLSLPSKRRRLQNPHGSGIGLDDIPYRQDTNDVIHDMSHQRGMGPLQAATALGLAMDGPDENRSNAPGVEDERQESVSPTEREPHAEDLEMHPAGSLSGMPPDSSYLSRLDRAVVVRTDSIKQEEPEEKSPRSRRLMGLQRDPQRRHTNGPCTASNITDISKELSDRLLYAYITREYVNLPIFDLAELKLMYEAATALNNMSDTSITLYETLNVMFSVTSLSVGSFADTKLLPDFNYRRSSGPLIDNQTDWTSIQCYILQCQHLCALGDWRLAWSLIGFAIRMAQVRGMRSIAQGLGQGAYSKERRETARKLWHGAMIMERMISLQVGIPPQTSSPLQVPFPSYLDTDYVDGISGRNSVKDAERPSVVEFLATCATLYAHVEDIVSLENELRFRRGSCAVEKLRSLDTAIFFKTDCSLYDWNSSLPSYLQKDALMEFQADPVIGRQRNICRVRYLYIRLRLYRPLLILGLALSTNCNCKPGGSIHLKGDEPISPDSLVALTLVRDTSFKCVAAALEIIDALRSHGRNLSTGSHAQRGTQLSANPPFYESVDYIYACGIVLLAARLCPLFSGAVNASKVRKGLSNVFALLEDYEEIYQEKGIKNTAGSCLRALRALSETAKNPTTSANVTMAFSDGTSFRTAQQLGTEAASQGRAGMSNASDSDAVGAGDTKAEWQESLGWAESLLIDLSE